MKRLAVAVFIVMSALSAGAEPPRLSFTLAQVIEAALRQSPELRAAEFVAAAADDEVRAERGRLYPQLSVEGRVQRVTEIPTLILPTGQSLSLTDNESYSIGPAARWTLFKGGANYYGVKSAQAQSRSRRLQAELIRRRQKLAARLSYFQAQLAAEQVRLLVESFKVENQQYQDIRERFDAGASSRIDLLSAHQQTLNRRRQLLDARSDLAQALREITRLTGLGAESDPSLPLDGQALKGLPPAVDTATVVLDIAAAADTLKDLLPAAQKVFDKSQPGIAYLSELAAASHQAAKSLQGSRWPELNVLAKTSWDYPNGPIRETIHQNTLGATLNIPLFTGGQVIYGTEARKREALAAEQNRDAAARDLLASWQKARDQVRALGIQQPLNETTLREAQELARLQYQSYRAGRSRYLDVEDANLKVLQAKTAAAQTDVRMLVQLATLDSLSAEHN